MKQKSSLFTALNDSIKMQFKIQSSIKLQVSNFSLNQNFFFLQTKLCLPKLWQPSLDQLLKKFPNDIYRWKVKVYQECDQGNNCNSWSEDKNLVINQITSVIMENVINCCNWNNWMDNYHELDDTIDGNSIAFKMKINQSNFIL